MSFNSLTTVHTSQYLSDSFLVGIILVLKKGGNSVILFSNVTGAIEAVHIFSLTQKFWIENKGCAQFIVRPYGREITTPRLGGGFDGRVMRDKLWIKGLMML